MTKFSSNPPVKSTLTAGQSSVKPALSKFIVHMDQTETMEFNTSHSTQNMPFQR